VTFGLICHWSVTYGFKIQVLIAMTDAACTLLVAVVGSPSKKSAKLLYWFGERQPFTAVEPPLKLKPVGCTSLWFMCCRLTSVPKRTLCFPLDYEALPVY
jgi:hypothetical protein